MDILFANNAESTLAAGISAVATSMTIVAADASKFPAPTGGRIVKCTLVVRNTLQLEIVHITARVGNVLTIVRGQEGTVAKAFSTGDLVAARWTADCARLAVNRAFSYRPAIVGAGGTVRVVTAVTIVGPTATCFSAGHGYANGATVYHWFGLFPNRNLEGVFVVANVTANTYDITFRTDASNTVPVSASGLGGNAQQCADYSVIVGEYRVHYDECRFQAWIVTSALSNIAGSVLFIPPLSPAAKPSLSIAPINLAYYSGITHGGALLAGLSSSVNAVIDLTKNVGSGLAPAALAAADLAAATQIRIGGSYFVDPIL